MVRYTTFLYHFFLVFNEKNKEKHVDWFGYPMTASPRAFDTFEKEYGYRLKTEDIVAQGTYQNNFVNPTKKLLSGSEYKMSKELFLLYHIYHMAKHFIHGGCGIKPFIDLWIIKNKIGFDGGKAQKMLQESGLLAFYERVV